METQWILQFVPPLSDKLSGIPNNLNIQGDIEPELQERVIGLVRDRLYRQQKLWISNVRDRREDQPAFFLQVGSSRSLSVCRIVRYFPLKDFQSFIGDILQIINKNEKTAANFNSIAKLKEIFLIPDEVAEEIFSAEVRKSLPASLSKTAAPSDEERHKYSLQCSRILLEAFKNLEENHLAQINPLPVGTGFLVGATHLLTNYHVLSSEEVAKQCVAQFNFEEPLKTIQQEVNYELDPDVLFVKEPSLDYALVQLKFNPLTRQAGHNFGWLQLIENDENILPDINNNSYVLAQLEAEGCDLSAEEQRGDNVILIHHPKGRQKKIDSANNRVTAGGMYKKFLRYQGEADYGSSGCSVFNTRWELIALNHAAIPQKDGTFVKQGIRICAIIADLKQKAASQKLKSFIEDFVITSEQLNYPPLAAAIELDGERSYLSTNSSVVFASAYTEKDKKTGKDVGTVKLWGRGGLELKAFTLPSEINDISFNSRKQILAVAAANSISLWRTDGTPIASLTQGAMRVKFSSSGNMLVAWWQTTLTVFQCEGALSELFKVAVEHDSVALGKIDFSANDKSLTYVGLNGVVYSWEINNQFPLIEPQRVEIERVEIGNLLEKAAISPDGQKIALVRNGSLHTIEIWSKADNSVCQSISAQGLVINLCFSPDGQSLAAALNTHEVQFWRLSDGEPLSCLQQARVSEIDFSPDGKLLLSSSSHSQDGDRVAQNTVKLWHIADSRLIAAFKNAGLLARFYPDKNISDSVEHFEKNAAREITIEAWVNPDANSNGGTIVSNFLIDKTADLGYSLFTYKRQESTLGTVEFIISPQDLNDGWSSSALSAPLTFGKFSHVAVTLDQSRTIRLFVDGQKLAEIQQANVKLPREFGRADAPEVIGAYLYDDLKYEEQNGTTTTTITDRKLEGFFKGAIAEVRFWNKARSQAEIKATMYRRLFGKELEDANLAGYWRMEEGSGDRINNLANSAASQKAYAKNSGVASNPNWLNTVQAALPFPSGLNFSAARERQPFKGHWDQINCVAFSPDGRYIVSGSNDTTVQIWNAQTGQPIVLPLQGHRSSIWSVAFSPDGKRIVSGSDDSTVRLWDAQTGQAIGQPLQGHEEAVLSVAFSPDGQWIASGGGISSDVTVKLWNAQTGEAIGQLLQGHESDIFSITFSSDGKRIASGSIDHTVRLWNAETGQAIGQPLQHQGWVRSVAFSPDGKRIVSGGGETTVRLWDAETGQLVGQPWQGHEAAVISVAFSPDGRLVISGSFDSTVRFWNAETGEAIGQPLQHKASVASVAFSPDGKQIVTGSGDKTVRLWDVQTGAAITLAAGRVGDGRIVVPLNQPERKSSSKPDRNTATDLETPGAITVEAWIKHQYGNCLITSRLGKNSGYSLGWHDDKIRVRLYQGSLKTVVDTQEKVVDDRVWHHIAFSWDKTTAEVSVYFDGRLQETVVIKGEHKSITSQGQYKNIGLFQGSLADVAANFEIGGSETSSFLDAGQEENEKHYFSMAIAQVRLWRIARTQTQIRAAMTQRLEYSQSVNQSDQYLENSEQEGLIGYWRLDEHETQQNTIQVRDLVGNHHGQSVGNVTLFPAALNKPATSNLKDIDGHWAEAFIAMAVNQGLLFDFPDNNRFFYPDQPITREEFVKVAVRAFQFDVVKEREQFSAKNFQDLEEGSPLFFTVQRAYQMGFLPDIADQEFYPDSNFYPAQAMKREEVLSLLVEGLRFIPGMDFLLSGDLDQGTRSWFLETELSERYTDRKQITGKYLASIATANWYRMVISQSYPETKRLEPARETTRAELAALTYQALVIMNELTDQNRLYPLSSPYIVNPDTG